MSTFSMCLATLAALYSLTFVYRVLKLVWDQGAIGEVVTTSEVINIALFDAWKAVTLPWIVIKTLCKRRA